jgi:integrase
VIPLPRDVRQHLIKHRLLTGRFAGLVFGRSADTPFDPATVTARAKRAWKQSGLTGITLHEARHVAASLMIDAGIALTSVSKFMGHSSISITNDVYGHLVTGAESRAAPSRWTTTSMH